MQSLVTRIIVIIQVKLTTSGMGWPLPIDFYTAWTHPWLPPWSTIATFSGESYCSNGGLQFIKPSPYDIGIRARAGKINPWAAINTELDALITNVSAADMPNFLKNRLIAKLEYAKDLKDNAKEECEAGNFDAATKKLGVAKDQVESFASMVKITRRISGHPAT